jgi:sarcosine oxidase subunit gamma
MNYEADIVRIGAMALFDLKGKKDALIAWLGEDLPPFPEAANTGSSRADAELLYIGRDHWLLLAPLEKEAILETALRTSAAPSDISIVQVSDSQTFFDITGPDAKP